nr:hypothetical protein [uncultured Rhodoferax sp.]
MERYEQTSLWQKTLFPHSTSDAESVNRDRLCAAYKSFRERARILGGEIAIDLPEFTVHDVTHLDALWEFADIVVGPDLLLTPAEAFVLGGAFLIHDLGMGLAAYPDGIPTLKKSPLWADTIASLLRRKNGSSPSLADIEAAPVDLCNEAMRQVLRELHAKQAERLALVSWTDRTGKSSQYHLIDDPDLRKTYGTIIGKIAHSHWWPVQQLEDRLPKPIGAPGGFDKTWTVDAVKLACILRAADASHIDERRAPGFLAALRKPQGVSADHWAFQEKLYQPRLEVDRLAYSSKEGFSIKEVAAWWTCYDTLAMIDKELRSVDALLADTGRVRLAARGVAQTEDPVRLATRITTDDWIPIDASIRVGNVAKLVSNLGGEKLYGHNALVPLRELIQNACDAVRARRLMENQGADWGQVFVRTGEDADGRWIEVEDSGIGMSKRVLTGPFLDFGCSLWGTHLMHQELPGLEAKGFASTGQFGIGFFSVFMWGNKVHIASRRAEAARDDTLVLEFRDGLGARPILRSANTTERLMDGGTRVRVWLRDRTIYDKLMTDEYSERKWTLESRCAWLCPALDVNLYVCSPDRSLVVGARDWISMPGKDFLNRLTGPLKRGKSSKEYSLALTHAAAALRLVKDDRGEPIGRCCVTAHSPTLFASSYFHSIEGVVTVGGFRANELTGIAGILTGTSSTAARNIAVPDIHKEVLSSWATEQADLAVKKMRDYVWLADIASTIRSLGGSTQKLPCAEGVFGWMSPSDIAVRYAKFDEVLLVQDASVSLARRHLTDLVLMPNVLAINVGLRPVLYSRDNVTDWPELNNAIEIPKDWQFALQTLEGSVIEALTEAWGCSLLSVLAASSSNKDGGSTRREVWTSNGKAYMETVAVIRNPNTHKKTKRPTRRSF